MTLLPRIFAGLFALACVTPAWAGSSLPPVTDGAGYSMPQIVTNPQSTVPVGSGGPYGWNTYLGVGAGGKTSLGNIAGYVATPSDDTNGFELTCIGHMACGGLNGTGMASGAVSGENTALGWHALGGIAFGGYDTGIGVNALGHCLDCQEDTAIGVDAMRNVAAAQVAAPAASFNVAVGFHSLAGNTNFTASTGQNNVAIGVKAMDGFWDAHDNVAIGLQAQEYPIHAAYNIAIGENALVGFNNDNASVQNDVAIGNSAMGNTSSSTGLGSAQNDVSIGSNSGQAIQSSSTGVLVGTLSGNALTTGNDAVFLGYSAGKLLTTANKDIMIGSGAGQTQTAGDQNIAIGYQEALPSLTTGNQLSIGNTLRGTLNTGTGNGNAALTVYGSFAALGGLSEVLTTPASSSAACTAGQFTDDANYHYVCTATNTWKRVALSTF